MGIQQAEQQISAGIETVQSGHNHEQAMAEAAQAMNQIGNMSQQFMQYAVQVMNEIEEKAECIQDKPKVIRIDAIRANGKLSAVPVYEEPDQEAPGLNIEETRE
jgi:hypothetical protein